MFRWYVIKIDIIFIYFFAGKRLKNKHILFRMILNLYNFKNILILYLHIKITVVSLYRCNNVTNINN